MFRVLFFILIIMFLGCNNNVIETTQVEIDKTQIVEEKKPCNFNLEEKLRTFYSPIPNEFRDLERDEKIKEELQNCPREEIVKSLANLQKSKKQDVEIQAKASYFLIKLNHNRAENGKLLVSTYTAKFKELDKKAKYGEFKDSFDPYTLMDLICEGLFENANGEFLSDAFDLVLLSDNAMAETLSGTLASQFEKTPELFLQKLKPKSNKIKLGRLSLSAITKTESNKIKQKTYSFLFYSIPKDKVLQHLASINKDSEVYSLVEEIQEFAKTYKNGN